MRILYAALAFGLAAALPQAAIADGQQIIVQAPLNATITVGLTQSLSESGGSVITVAVTTPPDTRRARVRRALFQSWSGFHRVYAGPRYPF